MQWFTEYVKVIAEVFAGKLNYWITFNEPQLFVGGGLAGCYHAPFERNEVAFIMEVTKHVLLAHGIAVKTLRETCGDHVKIGFAPTRECTIPKDQPDESIEEARNESFSISPFMFPGSNSWWADPIFKGDFPEEAKQLFGERLPAIRTAMTGIPVRGARKRRWGGISHRILCTGAANSSMRDTASR